MLIFGLMKETLNITLVQSQLFWEDVEKNISHFDALISEISEMILQNN